MKRLPSVGIRKRNDVYTSIAIVFVFLNCVFYRDFSYISVADYVYVTEIFIVFSLFVLLVKLGFGTISIEKSNVLMLLFIFILWGALLLVIDNGSSIFFKLREYAASYYSIFMFFVLALLSDERKTRLLFRTILIAASCSMVMIAYRYVYGFGNITTTDGVLRYGNYEFVGIIILFSYMLSRLQLGEKNNRFLVLVGILFSFFIVNFLIAHRSASLAMIVSFLVVSYFLGRIKTTLHKSISIIIILTVGTVLFAFLLPDFSQAALSRIIGVFNTNSLLGDANVSWRLVVWSHALSQMSLLDYLIGVGWGFNINILSFLGRDYAVEGFIGIHNSLVYYFLHMGLIGISLFLLLVFSVYRRAYRAIRVTNSMWHRKALVSLLAGNAGILFFALFNVVLEGPYMSIVFWVSLGLMFNISRHINIIRQDAGRGVN